jgi:hypothetical protein
MGHVLFGLGQYRRRELICPPLTSPSWDGALVRLMSGTAFLLYVRVLP